MPTYDTALEQNEYRLVLVKAGSHAIWAERNGNALRLPRVAIPRCLRQAEQLQQTVKQVWRLRNIVLDFLPGSKCSPACAVVEIVSPESPPGLIPACIDEIPTEEMNCQERVVVEGIVTGAVDGRGPFSRIGWIEEAMEWLRFETADTAAFTGEFRQYNAGGSFALIRFAADSGPAYWLKATGDPNRHEFHIVAKLADLCPEFLPRRIAAREDWNAWLMEDAGQPLDSWTKPALELAVCSLAELQKRTLDRTNDLMASGFFDQRIGTLRASLPDLVAYLDEAMTRQISTKVPRLEKRRLSQLASLLDNACSRMEDLGIPDTVVHDDINSGNILFSGQHCVFTDWCEAGVGNPFLTFQHLCLLQPGNGEDWNPRLREAYKQCWLEYLTASQIERAFLLMPLLAILSYLYGHGTWLHTEQRYEPHVESYARSLARHLDRAAGDSQVLEVLCH